jgi:hypothetical protein
MEATAFRLLIWARRMAMSVSFIEELNRANSA